jgi:hypothetical protein
MSMVAPTSLSKAEELLEPELAVQSLPKLLPDAAQQQHAVRQIADDVAR